MMFAQAIFVPDKELESLEANEEWAAAKDLLYFRWTADQTNLNNLLRVGTECWYVLTFWERIHSNGLEMIDFAKPLTEAKNFGFENFETSDLFNWIFGRMIRYFPYWFTDFDGKVDQWEKRGQEMIVCANELNPNNLIAKMLSLPEDSAAYQKARKAVRLHIHQLFPGNSAIEIYYRSILT